MSKRPWLFSLALAPFLGMPVAAQPVISARAGLIEFSDGVVFLNGDVLKQTPGRFDQMNEGSELRTQAGRAEVALTPGVFLRIGENSAVQMVANHLADTRVRLIDGTAIVDAIGSSPKTSVTLLYGDYQVQILQDGRFRFNAEPAELRVEEGKAEVTHNGNSLTVDSGHLVSLAGGLSARLIDSISRDKLDDWDQARSDSLAQTNQEAANTQDLSSAIDNWQNDPAAALSALGMTGYIPPPNYIPTAPYTGWVSSPYTPLGLNPYDPLLMSPWGYGMAGVYGLYGVPLNRNYILRSPIRGVSNYPYHSPIGVHPSVPTGVGVGTGLGVGRTGIYGGAGARPIAPSVPMHGGMGHVGGGGHR